MPYERRYGPTPYPGDVPKTLRYRDGWDRAWDLAKRAGFRYAVHWYRTVGRKDRPDYDDPYWYGYACGLTERHAWLVREQAELRRIEAAARVRDEAYKAEHGHYEWEPDLPEDQPF